MLVMILVVFSSSSKENFSHLEREQAVEFLKRTIFHPGKTKCEEQKREASEKYEERCEPSVNKLTGTRYCKFAFISLHRHLHSPRSGYQNMGCFQKLRNRQWSRSLKSINFDK